MDAGIFYLGKDNSHSDMETEGKWIKTVDLHDLYYRGWILGDFIALHRDSPSGSVAILLCVSFSGFSMFSEYPSQHVNHYVKIFKG